jgi:O-antigen ligase
MGGLSLLQYFTGIFPGVITDFTARLVWPYVDFLDMKAQSANWLAFMMLPGFILSFGVLFLEYRKGLRRRRTEGAWSSFSNLGAVITFIITGLVLLLVQSYGAFLGLGVAVVLLLFRNLPFKKFLVAFGILIVLGGGYFWYQKDSAKYKIITNEVTHKYVNSIDARGDIWKMNMAIVQKNWVLGVGLNQYQNYFRLFHQEVLGKTFLEQHIPPHPHNFFLGFWLNLGIFGLVGILVILGGMFYRFALEKQNLAMFVMIGILLHGMVDIYYWKQEIVYVFWLVILFAYLRPKH